VSACPSAPSAFSVTSMLHHLVALLLLALMPFDGLWIACNDDDEFASAGISREAAECIRICMMKRAIEQGAICILLPAAKTSVTVIQFGMAILPKEIGLRQTIEKSQEFLIRLSGHYASPLISDPSPPPRA
jgi:hypothetical protein